MVRACQPTPPTQDPDGDEAPTTTSASIEHRTGGMLGMCMRAAPDDVWVAAQTCREFRDAARGEFPRGWTARAVGVLSSVGRMRHAVDCGCTLSWARMAHAAAIAGRRDLTRALSHEWARRLAEMRNPPRVRCVADWQPAQVVEPSASWTIIAPAATCVRQPLRPAPGPLLGHREYYHALGPVERDGPTSVRVDCRRHFDVLAGFRPLGDYELHIEFNGLRTPFVPEYIPISRLEYTHVSLILEFGGPPPASYGVDYIGWKLTGPEREALGRGTHAAPFVYRDGLAACFVRDPKARV